MAAALSTMRWRTAVCSGVSAGFDGGPVVGFEDGGIERAEDSGAGGAEMRPEDGSEGADGGLESRLDGGGAGMLLTLVRDGGTGGGNERTEFGMGVIPDAPAPPDPPTPLTPLTPLDGAGGMVGIGGTPAAAPGGDEATLTRGVYAGTSGSASLDIAPYFPGMGVAMRPSRRTMGACSSMAARGKLVELLLLASCTRATCVPGLFCVEGTGVIAPGTLLPLPVAGIGVVSGLELELGSASSSAARAGAAVWAGALVITSSCLVMSRQ